MASVRINQQIYGNSALSEVDHARALDALAIAVCPRGCNVLHTPSGYACGSNMRPDALDSFYDSLVAAEQAL